MKDYFPTLRPTSDQVFTLVRPSTYNQDLLCPAGVTLRWIGYGFWDSSLATVYVIVLHPLTSILVPTGAPSGYPQPGEESFSIASIFLNR